MGARSQTHGLEYQLYHTRPTILYDMAGICVSSLPHPSITWAFSFIYLYKPVIVQPGDMVKGQDKLTSVHSGEISIKVKYTDCHITCSILLKLIATFLNDMMQLEQLPLKQYTASGTFSRIVNVT